MKYINLKSSIKVLVLFFFFVGMEILAQSTTLKLPTTDNTSSFDITKSDSTSIFRIFGDGGFYVGGNLSQGVIPVEGSGPRLMWYPNKSAFRVGYVTGTEWDDSNIGRYSIAMGIDTKASGYWSTAIGSATTASGNYSTAMGFSTTASMSFSTAVGYQTIASGNSSIAMGNTTTASGDISIAMGNYTLANGNRSTAIGNHTTASGYISTAMGDYTIASGDYSTAIGCYVSTNSKSGSFIVGDRSVSGSYTTSSGDNQMTMRFAGGYRFFTNSASSIGAYLTPNGNSWTAVSDSTKKENFINADGEYFLSSLSNLKLGSWNYKTQDSKEYRHYGPMAQEIFHYFGKDEVGTIGNDTTLATADMDGIMMIMLQALEKRTAELKVTQAELVKAREEIAELQNEFQEAKKFTDAKMEDLNQLITKLVDNKSSETEYSHLNKENKK